MANNPEKSGSGDAAVSLSDLKIIKGARHCRIVNLDDEIVFRTTNLRDAEAYLGLVEENRRLQHLMDSRGIAPHRIYLLENGDKNDEVVIVAKAGSETVIVRHLTDSREEVVDLDEVLPIPEADYFIGSEKPQQEVSVSVRIDQDTEMATLRIHANPEDARRVREAWRRASFEVDKTSEISASWSENGKCVFYDQIVVED
jgi:hypothetical protein